MSFISAPIEPIFIEEPLVRRRAGAPDAFLWAGARFEVVATLASWSEAGEPRWRRRRWRNRRQHVSSLGRDYYRVRTAGGRVFDLYYDRKLEGGHLGGEWILWRELEDAAGNHAHESEGRPPCEPGAGPASEK